MMTGETSFSDCYKKDLIRKITETANAAECGLKCTATCAVEFLVGEVRDRTSEKAAKEIANRVAKGLVKKWLLKGIPIAGHASTFYSLGRAGVCTVSCLAS